MVVRLAANNQHNIFLLLGGVFSTSCCLSWKKFIWVLLMAKESILGSFQPLAHCRFFAWWLSQFMGRWYGVFCFFWRIWWTKCFKSWSVGMEGGLPVLAFHRVWYLLWSLAYNIARFGTREANVCLLATNLKIYSDVPHSSRSRVQMEDLQWSYV